jgi:hypothetical protein
MLSKQVQQQLKDAKNKQQYVQALINEPDTHVGYFQSCGFGKTRIGLLKGQDKIMVVMPKINKKDKSWEAEKEKWSIDKDVFTISKEQFKIQHNKGLIGYADTLILDEAHTMLGVSTQTYTRQGVQYYKTSDLFKSILDWVQKYKPKQVLLLSATIRRTPLVVFGAGLLLGKKWEYEYFRDTFYIKREKPQPSFVKRPPIVFYKRNYKDKSLKALLDSYVQELGYTASLDEFDDIPEQTYITDEVEMTPDQIKGVKAMKLVYPDPDIQIGKKFQIENGLLIGNQYEPTKFFKNEKIEKLLDYASQFKKMVVYIRFTDLIHKTRDALIAEGYDVYVINGATENSGEIRKKCEELEECILIYQAGMTAGYQLPSFPVMVFMTKSNQWVDYEQGVGRIQRGDNLKKNIYIDLLTKPYKSSIEDKYLFSADKRCHDNVSNGQDFNEVI